MFPFVHICNESYLTNESAVAIEDVTHCRLVPPKTVLRRHNSEICSWFLKAAISNTIGTSHQLLRLKSTLPHPTCFLSRDLSIRQNLGDQEGIIFVSSQTSSNFKMNGLSTTSKLWIFILWLMAIVNGQLLQRKMTAPSHPRKAFSITQTRNPNWVPREIPVTIVYAAPFRKHKLRMPEPLKEAVIELAAEGELNSTNLPSRRRQLHTRANGLKTNNTNGL